MRARIDITEVETRTKIRAKYLRAIENEEWDLLPGPVYAKSFLRTYGDFLGLDSRLLVDEFRRRYEDPSDHDLRPLSTLGRERERSARGPLLPAWAVIGLVLVAVVAALAVVGANSNKPTSPTGTHAKTTGHRRHHRHRPRPAPATTAKLQLIPTGTVYVCLVDGNGTKLIDEKTFTAGQTVPPETAPKLLLTLGNAAVADEGQRPPGAGDGVGNRDPPADHRQRHASDPDRDEADVSLNPRAGILITGTEVLTGIISDRNGPWLSERLREIGVDAATIQVVGDRPGDLMSALRYMEREGLALIVTSGGLGPTADDLTAEIVGRFSGHEMVLDARLEERIAEILRPLMRRWPGLDQDAIRASNRKQAVIPEGATVLDPIGTAPGLVVPPASGQGPTVVVLPGPPRELQPMWELARATEAFQRAIVGATTYLRGIVRLFGIPESEIANTLRAAAEAGLDLEPLEITTCLRRGEIEVATRFEPPAQAAYDALIEFIAQRHSDVLFSRDGATIDAQVAELLQGHMLATAESCTGGLLAARLTELSGSSAYFAGAIVAYSNQAKAAIVGVDPGLIERAGAVSTEVAEALAEGAIARFGADLGVGITGIAGPGGGTDEKPVGLVCFSVVSRAGDRITRSAQLPGGRSDIRDRASTVAMHLIRRLLLGQGDLNVPQPQPASAPSVSE